MQVMSYSTRIRASLAVTLLLAAPVASAAEAVIDINDYHGKVVLIDFWASWCVPCRRSFPWLEEMQGKYGEQGLVVIGINMDADATDADDFLKKYPVSFRIVRDSDGKLARDYDVVAMPSSYVIDRNGNIVTRHLGFKTSDIAEYELALVAVLDNSGAVSAGK